MSLSRLFLIVVVCHLITIRDLQADDTSKLPELPAVFSKTNPSELEDLKAIVIKPNDCGGPLLNLRGQMIGINIARAGRTESYAIPSEAVRPIFERLKMSKELTPPSPYRGNHARR